MLSGKENGKSEPRKVFHLPSALLLGLNTCTLNYYSLYYSTYMYCKLPPCWRAQKSPTTLLKKYPHSEERKIRLWCMTKGEKKNPKKQKPANLFPRTQKDAKLCVQNKSLKPQQFTKPKIVLFTFQISASMRHFANMLRLQNVQVDKDMQRWPFNKSRLSQERLCPPGPQVPKNRDGVQWSWQRATQDPVTWGRSFTVRKPCPTPVLHPDQQEPL